MCDRPRAGRKITQSIRQDPDFDRPSVNPNNGELSWTPELFGPVFKTEKISLRQALQTHLTDKRTKMMATFVPDELIYALDLTTKHSRDFVAVLLLIDVSAFNYLWERFRWAANNGTHSFSAILNSYMSIMVEDIYFCEGDVINISGQEITAMWKVRRKEFIAKTIHMVIECALHLQGVMKDFSDGSRSFTKVKMAISSGAVIFSVIGNDDRRDYVVVGEPVREVQMAKKKCVIGDLVLTESAWGHVMPEDYEYVFRDAYNVKIIGIKENSPESNQRRDENTPFLSDKLSDPVERILTRNLIKSKQKCPKLVNKISDVSMLNLSTEESELEQKIFTGRFSMAEATRRKLGTHLKHFSKNPVLQQIEKDLPMEHLTETRKVSIVVINLETMGSSAYATVTVTDQCYILLCNIVSDHYGCVDNVTIYGRDVCFFVIFGLPNSAGGDEAKNGISCATKSLTVLKSVPGINEVSVGISTGTIYCGVIGHSERMEYVIIGSTIEKAIAITWTSRNKISCDFDTIVNSRFPRMNFRSRGMKDLKGFGRNHLYEFIGGKSDDLGNAADLDYVYPIVGRLRELEIFTDILDDVCASNRPYCGFLIEGSSRIGKSRLLDEIARIAESRQISVHKLFLDRSDASKPYAAVHRLLMDLLGAKDEKTMEEREKAVTKNLCDIVPCKDFCYLNIMMRVTFPLSVKYYSESEQERIKRTLIIFDAIINSLRGPRCIFFDDVQFMDSISWQFISRSMNNSKIILAMATEQIQTCTMLDELNSSIEDDGRIFRCQLEGLESEDITSLVCQLLNVQAIPRILDNIFKTRSNNHPGWCEAFITLLLQKKALDVLLLTRDDALRKDLIFPDTGLISKIPKDLSREDVTSEFRLHHGERNVRVCLTNNKFGEGVDSVLDIVDIHREIYDRSTTYEQALLQCAAILGNIFSQNMLHNILPNSTPRQTAYAVSRMIEMRILECASNCNQAYQTDRMTLCVNMKRNTFSDMHHVTQCRCAHSNVKPVGNLPQYSHCKLLGFKISAFKEFIYEKVTVNQRKEFHSKVTDIYERDARKCTACGGGSFIRIPGKEKPITIESPKVSYNPQRISLDGSQAGKSRRQNFESVSDDNRELRVQPSEMEVRRVSIMPAYFESEEEESTISLDVVEMLARVQRVSDITDESSKFRQKSSTCAIEAENDPSRISHLKNFNHIDFCNCQCNEIVDCLFWKLYQHLKLIGDPERLIRFMIDYNAGLIQTGQPFQALRLLAETLEKTESAEVDKKLQEVKQGDRQINRGAILALMGDACLNLGNLAQAKKYYTEAVRLCVDVNQYRNKICVSYRTFDETCKQRLYQKYPNCFVNRVTGSYVVRKLSAASYMARLSLVLLAEGETAISQLRALQSFNSGFSCSGSFLEKCDLYLKITSIFRNLGNISFAGSLEKPMIYTVRSKNWWSDVEEVSTVANVFKTMFEIRLLLGEYEDALLLGIKVLKITGVLKMNRTKLTVLPLLIQLTIRTKRIHETVDLMRELYHSASEDSDESSMTWYYALSLDLALDAGIILETFESCTEYAKKIITASKNGACAYRDPDSLRRLMTCIWLWQLRICVSVTGTFAGTSKFYARDIRADNFSCISTLAKVLESNLLVLMRCINMKLADQLVPLLDDIGLIVKTLQIVSKNALFIKPHLYMLKGYLEIVHCRKTSAMRYLKKGSKCAKYQGDVLMLARIWQNENTWTLKQSNNTTQHWIEHAGNDDSSDWRNIDCFNIKTWSSTLYPIPVPDTCL